MTAELVARLTAYRIEVLSEGTGFSVLARENCIAMVHVTAAGVLDIGSSGVMTESGLAYLVWREGEARLVAKGSDHPAGPEQVEAIRNFSADLKAALADPASGC